MKMATDAKTCACDNYPSYFTKKAQNTKYHKSIPINVLFT